MVRRPVQQRHAAAVQHEQGMRFRHQVFDEARATSLISERQSDFNQFVIVERSIDRYQRGVGQTARAHVDNGFQGMAQYAQIIALFASESHRPVFFNERNWRG